jgi:predicted nucleic acid-binding protein
MARTFVDTNVLVYAHDLDAGQKRIAANSLLATLWQDDAGALSTQVLKEFYVTVTRKMPTPLSRAHARSIASRFSWCVETGPDEIAAAFQLEDEHKIGFWDALIVAAAVKSSADRILPEDLNAGQRYAGVVVENPFAGSRS